MDTVGAAVGGIVVAELNNAFAWPNHPKETTMSKVNRSVFVSPCPDILMDLLRDAPAQVRASQLQLDPASRWGGAAGQKVRRRKRRLLLGDTNQQLNAP